MCPQTGRQCEMSRVPLLFSHAGDPLAFLRQCIRGRDMQSACLLLLLVQDRALELAGAAEEKRARADSQVHEVDCSGVDVMDKSGASYRAKRHTISDTM